MAGIFALASLAFKPAGNEYKVDTQKSKLVWLGKKVTGEHTGTISLNSGTFLVEKERITGGKFEINMNSMTCTDLTDPVYAGKLIDHLKNDDFFSTEKFPTASFQIVNISTKGNKAEVVGKMTIKGITKDIAFPAEIRMVDRSVIAVANIIINRIDYDVKYNSASIFSNIGDKAIDDMFNLQIQLVATK